MKNLSLTCPPFVPGSITFTANAGNEKYDTLIEHYVSAFFLTIPDGTILETNEAASQMFGYSAEEFKTLKRQDIIDHNNTRLLAALKERKQNGHARVEATGIKKNGTRFSIDICSVFFLNAQGQPRTSTLISDISEQKKIAQYLEQVLESITHGFFTVDKNWNVQYWNAEAEKITGIKKKHINGKKLWYFFNGSKKSASFLNYEKALQDNIPVHFEEYYEAENIWLEINICPSESGLSVFFKDITETRRLKELERIEKEFLENNARANSNLNATLGYYLKAIEKIHPGMLCSVLKLQDGKLYNWSSPSLPLKYCAAIDGMSINANAGSCGTAAYKKEKVIVTDIENDIRWNNYKSLALNEGLRSCWSFPIINSKDEVLGTFAIYYKEVKAPAKEEEKTIERARNILGVILENKTKEILLQSSVENYKYLFNNNPSSIIIWDIDTFNIIEVNETAIELYGYTRAEFLRLTVLDLRTQNEQQAFIELFSQAKGNDLVKRNLRWQHIIKGGTKIIMEVTSHPITYNGKRAVLALGNNVTEKVQLENSLLEERKIRQKQITDAVITGQEKERVEIGQELHDNINQILATSKLYLECALTQKGFRPKLIAESKMLTEKAMLEIRNLSNTLLPPSLEEIGLLEALTDLIKNITLVHPLKISTNWGGFEENSMDKKLRLTVFRIVQEQLNNIIKHAHASKVQISIVKKDDQICLCIEDDGIGFDTSKKRSGVGLKNIISRSEVNNGKVSVQSKPGEGCIIAVCFATDRP